MNNEEKILEALSGLQKQMGGLQEQVGSLQIQVGRVETRLDSMDTRLDSMDARLKKVELTQDNILVSAIQQLAEGQKAIIEQMATKEDLAALEERIDIRLSGAEGAIRYIRRDAKA